MHVVERTQHLSDWDWACAWAYAWFRLNMIITNIMLMMMDNVIRCVDGVKFVVVSHRLSPEARDCRLISLGRQHLTA